MMLYSSSKHHIDTMLYVVVFTIARANSCNSSSSYNKTRSPTYQYHASFIDFLLDDGSLSEFLKSNKINQDQSYNTIGHTPQPKNQTKVDQHPIICSLLSNLLNSNQMKFCNKHQEVLEIILPQVMRLTRRECIKITADLKWNCSSIDYLLNKSNPLAFTREAALVRSILNAAMVYLVLKTCSEDRNYHSCGCQNNLEVDYLNDVLGSEVKRQTSELSKEEEHTNILPTYDSPMMDHDLSLSDLRKLDSGFPLKLTSSVIRRQGCLANTAFASAFTRVFIDSDDIKSLNKAYKILNGDHHLKSGNISLRRVIDTDSKDLAYIKWSKSAINLHNNHVGRQMVRHAIQRKCRCHGVSGVCPFQTCWDQLLDFETISMRLRLLYLAESSRVEVRNIGSSDRPDLCLNRLGSGSKSATAPDGKDQPTRQPQYVPSDPILSEDLKFLLQLSTHSKSDEDQSSANIVRVKSDELIYLYESPEFCDPIPQIGHPGTKGRPCEIQNMSSSIGTNEAEKRRRYGPGGYDYHDISETIPGSCEHLCCNRGCRSELVLEMVTCNCKFKFCCKVECDHCIRQKLQHFCL